MEQKTLVKKLVAVMKEVKYIQKRGHNKFHNYKYATEADVNEKVREELAKLDVIMMPSMKSHSMRTTTTKNGNTEYIVCVDMDFTFMDGESGETLTISMSGEGQDVGDKAIFKAISGAQKYALMKAFMIPTGDDPEADEGVDERNNSKPTTQPPKTNGKPASEPTLNLITKLINELAKARGAQAAVVYEKLKEAMGTVVEQENWTQSLASQAIDVLNEWKKKQGAA